MVTPSQSNISESELNLKNTTDYIKFLINELGETRNTRVDSAPLHQSGHNTSTRSSRVFSFSWTPLIDIYKDEDNNLSARVTWELEPTVPMSNLDTITVTHWQLLCLNIICEVCEIQYRLSSQAKEMKKL